MCRGGLLLVRLGRLVKPSEIASFARRVPFLVVGLPCRPRPIPDLVARYARAGREQDAIYTLPKFLASLG